MRGIRYGIGEMIKGMGVRVGGSEKMVIEDDERGIGDDGRRIRIGREEKKVDEGASIVVGRGDEAEFREPEMV